MCQFPRTAIINNLLLSSLKQHKFILSQLWRAEVQNQGVTRAMLLPKALENPYLLIPASGSFWCFLFVAA